MKLGMEEIEEVILFFKTHVAQGALLLFTVVDEYTVEFSMVLRLFPKARIVSMHS